MTESDLAAFLGVPRTEIVAVRKENPEYSYKVGRTIHWTDAGKAFLYKELRLDTPLEPGQPRETFATTGRCWFPNKKLVEAHLENGKQILVRVKDSGMYVPKMQIPIKPDGNGWVVSREFISGADHRCNVVVYKPSQWVVHRQTVVINISRLLPISN